MNVFSVISFAMALTVFFTAVLTSTKDPRAMLDFHGLLIVVGGTLSATAISFQVDRIFVMLKVFWNRTLRGKKPNYVKTITELMHIAEAYRSSPDKALPLVEKSQDIFIKEAMMTLMDGIVDLSTLVKILNNRVNTMFERYNGDANRFKSIGKFPPAMGLMGAVLGMIALLASLGKPGAEKGVGPAMSVALVATFYGIAIANLLIIPIGENLGDAALEIKTKNKIIIEGVKLIAKKTNPIILAEELNSYLLPGERIDLKKLKKG